MRATGRYVEDWATNGSLRPTLLAKGVEFLLEYGLFSMSPLSLHPKQSPVGLT